MRWSLAGQGWRAKWARTRPIPQPPTGPTTAPSVWLKKSAAISRTQKHRRIACWDSKYRYLFWRPIMAIRNAQIDGNLATTPDPNWTPLLTTPNHPEYPAAHTCVTGAEAEMYAVVLGTHHINVTIHGSADGTPNNSASTHTFKTVKDLQREVANARVWAGLHYRGSALEGLELARNVARWTLRRYSLPVF